jgi:hypothetical protein
MADFQVNKMAISPPTTNRGTAIVGFMGASPWPFPLSCTPIVPFEEAGEGRAKDRWVWILSQPLIEWSIRRLLEELKTRGGKGIEEHKGFNELVLQMG